jgi:arsenical pump membrane protein
VSWGALALVAGLFVMVAALEQTGVVASIAALFDNVVRDRGTGAVWLGGGMVAAGCNLTNNLPAGLVLGRALGSGHAQALTSTVLVGIDLGPNFSITGSLASVLWLQAIRRDGYDVTAWAFLKLGLCITAPALVLALAGLLLTQ